ncbi:hypothetical protein ACIRPT_02720 [Streptomyces sp. NPDC101227]|uniref:hypothetical protein n=1 Tax=Streptomyces sp. NPDC101227 TaxID=3366136 RepID=UPI0038301821
MGDYGPGYSPLSKVSVRRWYKAYDPNGKFKECVQLDSEAVKRYEAKGWTFQKTTSGEAHLWVEK